MAIVGSARPLNDLQVSEDARGNLSISRTYNVFTDNASDDAITALGASGLPARGDVYGSTGAVCTSRKVKFKSRDGAGNQLWEVAIEWSQGAESQAAQEDENPLDRPVQISIDFEQATKAITKDINGDQIVNSAGDRFPPIVVDKERVVVTAIRNEASIDFDALRALNGRLNDDTFLGYDEKMVRLRLRANKASEGDFTYWVITYQFVCDEDGFKLEPLDEGMRVADGDGFKNIVDQNNIEVTEPVNLDGNGAPLDVGQPGVYLSFDIIETTDFSALGLF